jgi:hypothetical protein
MILAAALAATAALTFQSSSVQASDLRVSVGVGDVVFDAGIPYYRVTHEPVYVTYTDNQPTYYRVVTRTTTYNGPSVPPPWAPAYGWRAKKHHRMYHGYYDVNGNWHWD